MFGQIQMCRKYIVVVLFVLIPQITFAIDLNKGLLESQDNWSNRSSFLKGGTELEISPIDLYPVPIFGRIAARSMQFTVGTNKEKYHVGENVDIDLSVKNKGYDTQLDSYGQQGGSKNYYLWAEGNIYVEIYRLSEEIRDGELLVASGSIYEKSNLSLWQSETNQYKTTWTIPNNAISGKYEIRVFPSSAGLLFNGFPDGYRTFTKTRFIVEESEGKREKIVWKLGEIKIDKDFFRQKEKILTLDADKNYIISAPIENTGDEAKKIYIKKQVRYSFSNSGFGVLASEETEELTIGSKEKKIITYAVNNLNIEGKSGVNILFSFIDDKNKEQQSARTLSNYPLMSRPSESIIIPMNFRGNTHIRTRGMGFITAEDQIIFSINSRITYFMEVERFDPLYYDSAESRRAKEDGISLSLALLDRSGNKIDEIGYEGPSWDRSGEIYKTIDLEKSYDYLKLVGILSSKGKGELERKEIEYINSEKDAESILERIKEILENNWVTSVILATVIITASTILSVVLMSKKKIKTNL